MSLTPQIRQKETFETASNLLKTPACREFPEGAHMSPLSPPEYLLWEITLRCNFKCLHCAAAAGRPRKNELSTDEAFELCEQIAELQVPAVALMGGEPLLRKDWGLIARRLRSFGIEVGLITNGFLFDEKVAEEIQKLDICQVGISLDAANPQMHNFIRGVKRAYERAVSAIRIVNSLGITYPTAITSVNKYNIGELEGMLEFFLETTEGFLWIINFSSDQLTDRSKGEWVIDQNDFFSLAEFIHKNKGAYSSRINISGTHGLGYYSKKYTNLYDFEWEGCAAGIKALGVRSNGDVAGCLILPDPFIEGNVRERHLADIWNDDNSFSYTRKFDARRLRGKCRKCLHGKTCKAGCTNIAYSFMGTIYEAPFCFYDYEKLCGR